MNFFELLDIVKCSLCWVTIWNTNAFLRVRCYAFYKQLATLFLFCFLLFIKYIFQKISISKKRCSYSTFMHAVLGNTLKSYHVYPTTYVLEVYRKFEIIRIFNLNECCVRYWLISVRIIFNTKLCKNYWQFNSAVISIIIRRLFWRVFRRVAYIRVQVVHTLG